MLLQSAHAWVLLEPCVLSHVTLVIAVVQVTVLISRFLHLSLHQCQVSISLCNSNETVETLFKLVDPPLVDSPLVMELGKI